MSAKLSPARRNVLALIGDGKVERAYGGAANSIAWRGPDRRSLDSHISALVRDGLIETPDTRLYATPVLTDAGRAELAVAVGSSANR